MQLMREALAFSVGELGATHIFGDFFAEPDGSFQAFYRRAGFKPVSEPYRDVRFAGSPLSIVGMVEIKEALTIWREGSEAQRKLLDFFFADYEQYASLVRPG